MREQRNEEIVKSKDTKIEKFKSRYQKKIYAAFENPKTIVIIHDIY